MCRNVLLRRIPILTVCVLTASLSVFADDGPPPLTPPAGAAPIAPTPIPAPISPRPAAAPSTPPRDDNTVLALPGINVPTRPRSTQTTTAPQPPPSLAPSSDGGLAPLEMPATRAEAAATTELLSLPSSRFRGNVIESVPNDITLPALEAPSLPTLPRSTGAYRPRTTSNMPGQAATTRSRLLSDESDDLDIKPKSLKDKSLIDDELDLDKAKDRAKDKEKAPLPPRPRFNLFSRFTTRPVADEFDSQIKVEPRSDPAADAAIKRRIEKAVKETVGGRARSVDVRVSGRSITIQAHGVNFFQRRTIRRSLETMPGLSGYRSNVEVD